MRLYNVTIERVVASVEECDVAVMARNPREACEKALATVKEDQNFVDWHQQPDRTDIRVARSMIIPDDEE